MQVNDRVTVKTDGGPRRSGVVLAMSRLVKERCIWFHWKTILWGSGFLMK